MTTTKILITGAAGRIGAVLTNHFSGRYELLLSDLISEARAALGYAPQEDAFILAGLIKEDK